jgi:hypothetical protein
MATTKAALLAAIDNLRTLVRNLPDDDSGGGEVGPTPATLARPPLLNQASAYGVTVQQVGTERPYWAITVARHLSPDENKGKRSVFVQVFDANGWRVRDSRLRIMWTWAGRQPWEIAPPAALDKVDGPLELGHGNLDLYWGARLSVWVDGDGLPSDVAQNLHTMHPAEVGSTGEKWNYEGHHSFYIRFQRMTH